MLIDLKNRFSSFTGPIWQRGQTGQMPYDCDRRGAADHHTAGVLQPTLCAGLSVVSDFISLVYVMPLKRGVRIGLGLVIALVLIPIVGMRNIFYLEVIFQISLFAALALGLNIVVGFAGLLNMGYVAFYAVGAYLWAFFGSQQPFLLHSIPGTVPPGTPYFLNPNFFFLFLFLGMAVAAVVGILLGLPVLRVRGDYLAIVTLGFGEVIRVLANNLDKPLNLTNGPQGITPDPAANHSSLCAEWLERDLWTAGRPASRGRRIL